MRSERERVATLLFDLRSFEAGKRESSISILEAMDRATVVSVLIDFVHDRDPERQCDAAEALLRIDAGRTIEIVLPLLKSPDMVVRWAVAGLLHDFGNEHATGDLSDVLLNDPEPDVRLMAAFALGTIGNLSALPALRQVVEMDEGADRDGRSIADGACEALQSIISRQL